MNIYMSCSGQAIQQVTSIEGCTQPREETQSIEQKNMNMTGGDSSANSTTSDPMIIRSARLVEPMHFKFEIEGYKELVELYKAAGYESITSTEFRAGDHTWSLVVYPTGSAKDNGQDHVSLYVRLVDDLQKGERVYSSFKFFILDYENDKYKIVQDGRQRCFDADHREWGISKAIRLQAFRDEKKGLLVNGRCTFGVEVYVENQSAKISSLSKLKLDTSMWEQKTDSYTWPIYDFSTIRPYKCSPDFDIRNHTWTLRLYPKGYSIGSQRFLSLHLYLRNRNDHTEGKKLYVAFEFTVKDQVSSKDYKKIVGFWFEQSTDDKDCLACDQLIELSDLNNPMNGFRLDDQVIIEVTVTEMFVLDKKAVAVSNQMIPEAPGNLTAYVFNRGNHRLYSMIIKTYRGLTLLFLWNLFSRFRYLRDPMSARIKRLEQELNSFKKESHEKMVDLNQKLDQTVKVLRSSGSSHYKSRNTDIIAAENTKTLGATVESPTAEVTTAPVVSQIEVSSIAARFLRCMVAILLIFNSIKSIVENGNDAFRRRLLSGSSAN